MMPVSRRNFVGLCAAAGGAGTGLTSDQAKAEGQGKGPGRMEEARVVDFVGDGIPHTPSEFASLLARLASEKGATADEYSRGGAVAALEEQFARLLGKEAAVFMPSGTLANHLAVRTLAGKRRRVIVQEISHLYNDSGDCAQELSALTLIPLSPGRATFNWDDVAAALDRAATGRVATSVGAISIESPVRRLRNEVFDFAEMQRISTEARQRGIGLHLDGARLFVAAAYSGRRPEEYAALFDTVYVSLWKCFNSGGGAVIAGPRALLADLYHVRRMFGGALWEAWPYALVASHYAEGYLERLTAAVKISEALLAALGRDRRFRVERVKNGTSCFRLEPLEGDLAAFRETLRSRRIVLPAPEGDGFWMRVNETLLAAGSADALARSFQGALG